MSQNDSQCITYSKDCLNNKHISSMIQTQKKLNQSEGEENR